MTWADVLHPIRALPADDVDLEIAECLDHSHCRNDSETEFLRNVRRQRRRLSERQSAVLDRILLKIRQTAQ
jgi:hypothetical protein